MSRAENVLNSWESSYGMDELPDHWANKARIAELRAAIKEDLADAWDEGERHESEYLDTWGQFCPGRNCNPHRSDHAAE